MEIASFITLIIFIMSLSGKTTDPIWFAGLVSLWLWLTAIFATFAEAQMDDFLARPSSRTSCA